MFPAPCHSCEPNTSISPTKEFIFLCFLLLCISLLSDQNPAPHMTGLVHQTLSPTCGQSSTTSLRMKQSWRNGCDTWGRRRRTGTTSSGPSRTSPSARLRCISLLSYKSCSVTSWVRTLQQGGSDLWPPLRGRAPVFNFTELCSVAEGKFPFPPVEGSTTPHSCQAKQKLLHVDQIPLELKELCSQLRLNNLKNLFYLFIFTVFNDSKDILKHFILFCL